MESDVCIHVYIHMCIHVYPCLDVCMNCWDVNMEVLTTYNNGSAPLSSEDEKNGFKGTCKFHGNCIEGMANAIAIAKRNQVDQRQLDTIPDDDPVWDNVAHYLAHLCHSLMSVVSCHTIIVGGGVLKRQILLPKIHQKFVQLNNGYVNVPRLQPDHISNYIVSSIYGDNAGIVGAIYLAQLAAATK